VYSFLNNAWGAALCLGIMKGLTSLGKSITAPSITQLERFQTGRAMGGVSAKQYAEIWLNTIQTTPGYEHIVQTVERTAKTLSGMEGNANALLKAAEQVAKDLGAWEGPSLLYRIFSSIRCFAMGLIFPAEIIQGFSWVFKGEAFIFSSKLVSWLLNWGVMTFVFPFFKEQSTWGMMMAFIAAMQGDWSHFVALSPTQLTYQFLYQVGSSAPVVSIL
jgi:hypothetical protein